MIIFGLVSGLFISVIHNGARAGLEGMEGALLLLVVSYPVFKIGGLGGGDVKLFSVVGSYLGIKGGITSLIFAFVFGAMISLVKMIRFHNFKDRIYYFFSYLADIFLAGKWRLYEISPVTSLKDEKAGCESFSFPKHKIHFALPVFLGVIVYMGGVLWDKIL